jgi:hypothetical protein
MPLDTEDEDDEALWRKYTLCEEDRLTRYPNSRPSGERWFRSHNVIPIERWRARRIVRQSNDDPAAA